MSDPKALIKLVEYPLYWEELAALPDDQTAYFSLVSYAASELNALARTYIQCAHPLLDDGAIDFAIMTQRFTLLRTWSAKLFELTQCLVEMSKTSSLDDVVSQLVEEAVEDFKSLRDHEAYSLARNVRNEATSHYSFSAAKKNLKHVPKHAHCKMYIHTMDGNSFYPLGEEVMFAARINRSGTSLKNEEEKKQQLDRWSEWNLEANRWMGRVHLSAFRKIIITRFPDRNARQKIYWLEPNLVANAEPPVSALFLRKSP